MKKARPYSLYGRIIVIILIPFLALLIVLLGLYRAYYSSVLHRAEENFSAMAGQNRVYIEEKLADIRAVAQSAGYSRIAQQYFTNMGHAQRVNNYPDVRQLFTILLNANQGIQGIYMMDSKQAFLDCGNGYLHLFDRANVQYDLQKVQTGESFFTGLYRKAAGLGLEYCLYYLPVGVIPTISVTESDYRLTCAVLFDVSWLLGRESLADGMCEVLIWEGQIVASNGTLTAAERTIFADIAGEDAPAASGRIQLNGGSFYLQTAALSCDNGLFYAFLVPTDSLMGDFKIFWNFSLVMIAGCALVMFFLIIQLRRSISAPIAQITDDMKRITTQTPAIRDTNVTELRLLTDGVNQMLTWLQQMQRQEMESREKIYQMNLRKAQAEMQAYRGQINPHFLFNTLECMSGMALHYHIEPLEQLIAALSGSFRYTLRTPDVVPLEQEVAHLSNYMRIMEIRTPDRYRIMLRVSPETRKINVLSLMLQPLAENAVVHGFEGFHKTAKCTLSLETWIDAEKNRLHIRMADNGGGISQEKLAEIQRHMNSDAFAAEKHHIALNNIYQRLKILYGNHSHLRITASAGYYTRVDIQIPLGPRA